MVMKWIWYRGRNVAVGVCRGLQSACRVDCEDKVVSIITDSKNRTAKG